MEDSDFILKIGDCIEELKLLKENSIDSIVTDPPYAVSIDKNDWDDFKSLRHFQKWCEKWAIECFRVLKPGGYIVAFSSGRTYHRLASGIEDAGFQVKDTINWVYFSGMPKGLRIDNLGTQLKPSCEPAVLAQKPISEKTYADQLKKTGTGFMNIDECRFHHKDRCWLGPKNADFVKAWDKPIMSNFTGDGAKLFVADSKTNYQIRDISKYKPTGGRFPANIYHCKKPNKKEKDAGIRASRDNNQNGRRNFHPTVKPLKLMKWLVRLVTPRNNNAVVLDPFLGSGTTGMACLLEGYRCIGIERNPEYKHIIESRIKIARKSISDKNLD